MSESMAKMQAVRHKPSVLESKSRREELVLALKWNEIAKKNNVDYRLAAGAGIAAVLPKEVTSILTESKPGDVDVFVRDQDVPKLRLGEAKENYLQDSGANKYSETRIEKIYMSPFYSYDLDGFSKGDFYTPMTGIGPIGMSDKDFEGGERVEIAGERVTTLSTSIELAISLTHLVLMYDSRINGVTKGSQRLLKAFLLAAYTAERRGINYLTDEVLPKTRDKLVASPAVVDAAIARANSDAGLIERIRKKISVDRIADGNPKDFTVSLDTNLQDYTRYAELLGTRTNEMLNINKKVLLRKTEKAGMRDSDNNERVFRRLQTMLRQTAKEAQANV